MRKLAVLCSVITFAACDACVPVDGHGPIADGIMAPLGEPIPSASAEQLETFERGKEVALHRFTRAEGLGPAFNIVFCAGCHEKPVFGGSAGTYRNFFLATSTDEFGATFPARSAGEAGGVVRMNYLEPRGVEIPDDERQPIRPLVDPNISNIAQRNPIPFFGVGLLAELDGAEIEKRADPDDLDGDGISGRVNTDRGFVGRFGRKSQTVSIEGFIRGPLFNHLGITTDPLTEAQRAALPVDSSGGGDADQTAMWRTTINALVKSAQAAAADGPTTDDDEAEDPEMTPQELFDVISFAMLMAAPEVEPLNDETRRGLELFDNIGCNACHTPRLVGPRGPLPVYSDLLIHDMGPELADGLAPGDATGSEFRTQPLWGIGPVGPYLHDGRAATLDEAIRFHGGEAQRANDRYAALSEDDRSSVIEFLLSLGGRSQTSKGLIPPGDPMPAPNTYGGPLVEVDGDDLAAFERGRLLFDREFMFTEGAGAPRFNGDSCRACHFEPVFGGAGPRGVNVIRHGILNNLGEFTPPAVGTILHRQTSIIEGQANEPQNEANIFEGRQTPHLFGLGVIETISEEDIIARADPDDADGDGISGRAARVDGGRLGRFGWKAQVPSIKEFVRDAVTAELGMTLALEEGLTFGRTVDNDDIEDPEFNPDDAADLEAYLRFLAPPPRQDFPPADRAIIENGEQQFDAVGCTACHTPSMPSDFGPAELYSDLLLHEILPEGAPGIEDSGANMREFRTPPLWGIATTAPYMHNGLSDTLREAIEQHDGEAAASRDNFQALSSDDQDALLRFLNTL